MLPPLKIVRQGLRRTTEALAMELACPGHATPAWSELDWRLAAAVAAAHGISSLLHRQSPWQQTAWRRFLYRQYAHVEQRHARITTLLERIDAKAAAIDLPIVPLKGSALHAIGLYAPGERPMADIDLLVRDEDVARTSELLRSLGYAASFAQWKHLTFTPSTGLAFDGLGEHRDTPINIELHTHIHERLPLSTIDITERVYPSTPRPGLNAYPSYGALMSHLLLHAAGNICGRSMRLMHLNDISLLATRMRAVDWNVLQDRDWWALPPLRLVSRYYAKAIPDTVMARIEPSCSTPLRIASRRQTLTDVSCSALWLNALPGIEWSRSLGEAVLCVRRRLKPTEEATQERADMVRTQVWLQGQPWVTQKHSRRLLTRLTRPVPRMDTLYVVRAAMEHFAL